MNRITKLLVLMATVVSTVAFAGVGWAYWSTSGTGRASASVGTLAAPTAVVVPGNSSGTVAVSWTASSTASPNVAPTGYYVQRYAGTTPSDACGSSLSPARILISAVSCNDTGVPAGTYSYKVTAIYKSWTAQSASSAGQVVVSTGAVTAISPNSRGQGATSQSITVTGAGFVSGASVSFSGGGVTATTTFVSSTSLTATVTVAAGAATGARDVTVTNPDAGTGTLSGGFTVNAAPTIATPTATTPCNPGHNTAGSCTITGTNFQTGLTVTGNGSISTVSVASVTSTSIVISVTGSGGSGALGSFTVTNPDGGTVSSAGSFKNG